MLTVENEMNSDSKSTNKRGPFLFRSLGLSCRYNRFLFCLGCWLAQYKIFLSSPFTISIPLSHRPVSWANSRAGSLVSYNMSLVPALNVHSTICTSFPMLLKEGQHVDDVSACLSIQITFKLLHAPLNREGYTVVQFYICTLR